MYKILGADTKLGHEMFHLFGRMNLTLTQPKTCAAHAHKNPTQNWYVNYGFSNETNNPAPGTALLICGTLKLAC